eukprot:15471974-Alexandrium_andersonii.AAC.1
MSALLATFVSQPQRALLPERPAEPPLRARQPSREATPGWPRRAWPTSGRAPSAQRIHHTQL